MKISEMIVRLEKIKAENGDLEILTIDRHGNDCLPITSARINVADDYPEDWNIPDGFIYVTFGSW